MTHPFASEPTPPSALNPSNGLESECRPKVVAPDVVDQMALSDVNAAAPSDGTGISGNLNEDGSEPGRDAPGTT